MKLWGELSQHRKAQIRVTVAVTLALIAHYLCELIAPQYEMFAPLVGLFANLTWIWGE